MVTYGGVFPVPLELPIRWNATKKNITRLIRGTKNNNPKASGVSHSIVPTRWPQQTQDLGPRSVPSPMEGQQGSVAESADELEVLCPCFGVAFANPMDIAILAAGGTRCEPSGEIRNVWVDGYRHAFIIQPLPRSRRT